jgi:hypothetical protein
MLLSAVWELARSGPLAFKRGAAAKARSSWGERLWLILSTWTTLSSTSIPRGRTLGFERWGFRPISWSRALRCPTRRRGPAAPLLSYSRSLLSVTLYTKCEHGVLNDITTGNNGAYAAGPGWDACTGLGTPQGQNLLKALSTAPTVASRKVAAHV